MDALKHRLRQWAQWLHDHRQVVIGLLCIFATVSLTQAVLAQDGGEKTDAELIEKLAIWIGGFIAWIAQGVISFVVLVIDILIIPILRYDRFTTSQVVGLGWAIVRDLVNMFFIVVLLLIAFQTIFGVGRADWRKQVPRLLLMAVVINFSRTICGLIIDFAQVIMVTFVNAIRDIAGGNFIQLLGLENTFTLSDDAGISKAQQEGIGPYELLITSFLTLFIAFVILGTVLTMTMLFAFRIVILWILIIMSPLAFFLGGAKGVIGPAEGYYTDWWKRFTSAVALGPILTFFLWLALAAAGTGNLAESQGFDTSADAKDDLGNSIAAQIITKTFDANHFTSLVIAIALLFAGIEISQQTASAIGGRAGDIAKSGIAGIPGLSRQLARIGIGAPAGAALAVGRVGAREYLGRPFLKAREKVGVAIGQAGAAISGVPVFGAAGRAVRKFGYGQAVAAEHAREAALKGAMDELTGYGTHELKSIAERGKALEFSENMRIQAARSKLLLDDKKRKELTEPEKLEYASALYGVWGDLDEATKDKWGKVLMKDPHLVTGKVKRGDYAQDVAGEAAYQKAQEKEVRDQWKEIAKSPGNLRTLSESAMKDPFVQKMMMDANELVGNTGKNAATIISEGGASAQQKERWESIRRDLGRTRTANFAQAVSASLGQPQASESLVSALKNLSIDELKSNMVTPEMLHDKAFFDAFTNTETHPNFKNLTKINPTLADAVNAQLDAQAGPVFVEEQVGGRVVYRGRNGEEVETKDITRPADYYEEVRPEPRTVYNRVNERGQVDRVYETREGVEADPLYKQSIDAQARAAKVRLAMGAAPPRSVGVDPRTGAFENMAAEAAFKNMVVNEPEIIVKLGADMGGAIGKAVAQAMAPEKISGLMNKIRSAPAGSAGQADLINAVDRISDAVNKHGKNLTDFGERMAELSHIRKRLGR